MEESNYYLKLEQEGYYETIDKRSKDYREYKDWQKTREEYSNIKKNIEAEPKGLGDVVAKITKATGIDKVVKFIAGEDCGCAERQEKWNAIPQFRRNVPKCIKEDDFMYLTEFFKTTVSKINMDDYAKIVDIYNYVFTANEPKTTSCNPCASRVYTNLKTYLLTYK